MSFEGGYFLMQYIKPKEKLDVKPNWSVSEQTKNIVKHYAQYTGYTEDEVVDMFLKNLRDDPGFIEWLKNKRRNKRAISQIFSDTDEEEENIG